MDCRLASVPFYLRMTAMPSTSARRQGTAPDAAPKICSLTLMACHWRDLAPHSAVRGSHSIPSWRVSLLRGRAQYLGNVDAPDERSAEAAAVSEFKLSDGQRKRLLVQERN